MILLGHYSYRARFQPVLLVLLPLALGVFVWTWPNTKWESGLWTIFITSGVAYFSAIFARNLGKKTERKLWESWGGAPTTQLLRYSGSLNPILRQRWHNKLSQILERTFPTKQNEDDNPKEADKLYESAVTLLRIKTRDIKKFNLIYSENASYGFCRNLVAMRTIGICTALLGVALTASAGIWFYMHNKAVSPYMAVCLGVNISSLFLWVLVIKPSWVKTSAFAYARRLLEAIEEI